MNMDKRVASHVLSTLENIASNIEALVEEKKLPKTEVTASIIKNIDSFSDKLEAEVFGEESFRKRQAKVIEQDSDESYMKTFENPQKVIEGESDEPYMHHTGPTFHGKGVPTYDSDDTSQVTERDEYTVREESEWSSGTKKQPSWSKGPAGKSTAWG